MVYVSGQKPCSTGAGEYLQAVGNSKGGKARLSSRLAIFD